MNVYKYSAMSNYNKFVSDVRQFIRYRLSLSNYKILIGAKKCKCENILNKTPHCRVFSSNFVSLYFNNTNLGVNMNTYHEVNCPALIPSEVCKFSADLHNFETLLMETFDKYDNCDFVDDALYESFKSIIASYIAIMYTENEYYKSYIKLITHKYILPGHNLDSLLAHGMDNIYKQLSALVD
jgi:hypothetical protein